MPVTPPRRRLVLVAALMALAFVPGSLSGVAGANAADPLDVALGYLDKNAEELGVTSADVADVAVTSQYRSSHNGVTHVNLNQRVEGLEVFGAHVTVNVAADGRVDLRRRQPRPARRTVRRARASPRPRRSRQPRTGSISPSRANPQVISTKRRPGTGDGRLAGRDLGRGRSPLRLGWQPTAERARGRPGSSSSTTPRTSTSGTRPSTPRPAQLLDEDDWTSHDNLGTLSTARSVPAARRRRHRWPRTWSRRARSTTARATACSSSRWRARTTGLARSSTNPADAVGVAVRLARHERHPRPRVHDHAGEQRARLPRPGRQQRRRLRLQPGRRARSRLRLPGRPERARAELPRRRGREPLLHEQRLPRPPLPLRDGRGGGQLPGQQLRPRRTRRRLRPGRGGRRQRHEQRELLDADRADDRHRRAADADVPLAREPVRGPEPGRRRRRSARSTPAGRASGPLRRSPARPARSSTPATAASPPTTPARRPATRSRSSPAATPAARTSTRARRRAPPARRRSSSRHTTAAAAPILTGSQMTAAPPTIPVASITQADGTAIRAAITAGPTTGTVRKHPSHPGIRDGDFENGIIIHEYGHGVSNRLTGGPAVNCLSGNEQAGEGWSDYLAISILLDPALDDPEPAARHGPVRALPGRPPRRRHPPAAVLPRHVDPAVHLRQHQDRRLAERDVAGAPARPRPRLGVRCSGI